LISSYKRSFKYIREWIKDKNLEYQIQLTLVFLNWVWENLYKKINELSKYFQSINKDEDFEQSINNLAESKKVIFDFFDNVIVNDEDITIKKNRLEL